MFEPDFIDFIQLLNDHSVEYLVVGAHALSFHGRPRHTGDLDIWINPEEENCKKIITVLREFGFESLNLSHLDFLKENTVTQLGYPPLRIDLLTAISGVNFDEAFGKKVIGEIDRLKINFINIEDFKANKLATGRPKDLGDLESLNSI